MFGCSVAGAENRGIEQQRFGQAEIPSCRGLNAMTCAFQATISSVPTNFRMFFSLVLGLVLLLSDVARPFWQRCLGEAEGSETTFSRIQDGRSLFCHTPYLVQVSLRLGSSRSL